MHRWDRSILLGIRIFQKGIKIFVLEYCICGTNYRIRQNVREILSDTETKGCRLCGMLRDSTYM